MQLLKEKSRIVLYLETLTVERKKSNERTNLRQDLSPTKGQIVFSLF